MSHSEWRALRRPLRLLALAAAALVTVLVGVVVATSVQVGCGPTACPTSPVGPGGQTVQDHFTFVHRPLGEHGEITVRLASMSGIITYPPPDHDEIVPGLVPWSKAGIIVKDGLAQGSTYAALMVTAEHGVRLQHDFTEDVAGSPDAGPRWLRLTRSGDTVTGLESADGRAWTEVGSVRLPGLPATAQVGLFAASPGDLTLRPEGLGATVPEHRFTQTTAVFDSVQVSGAGQWQVDVVGDAPLADWERFHHPSGLVESNGTLAVTGTGDIAPGGMETGSQMEQVLVGLPLGVLVVLVVAAGYGTAARTRRVLVDRARVIGSAAGVTGLLTAAVVLPLGTAILRANGVTVLAVPVLDQVRVVVGVGALCAVAAVLALTLGALFRRVWPAALLATGAVVLPAVLGTLPLLPEPVADLLVGLTPAAGFAVTQTGTEFPQVLAQYAPWVGYFPLPWWAGFAVLCGWAAIAFGVAARGHGQVGAERR